MKFFLSRGQQVKSDRLLPGPLAVPCPVGMSRRVRDRCLELERAIADRFRSGNLGLDDDVKLFDELLHHARPASVIAINQILTAFSRGQDRGSSTSALVVSLFNRMARAFPNKVAPDGFTYSILIGCFCRMGRLELGFASIGLVLVGIFAS